MKLIKSALTTLAAMALWATPANASVYNPNPDPVADPAAVVVSGKARFTVLTPQMIRIEYAPSGQFEDRASFTVVNRRMPVPRYTVEDLGEALRIRTDSLMLHYVKGTDPRTSPESARNLYIRMPLNGDTVTWYPGLKDKQNLKGTYRTLDGLSGDSHRKLLEDGMVSRSGWAVIDDSWKDRRCDGAHVMMLEPDAEAGFDWVAPRKDLSAMDTYFFGYGHDYKRAVTDFTRVAGRIPLPPAYVFGYWYSKYERYSQQDFIDIVDALRDNKIPADVMIVDTDWHPNVWTGYTWDKSLIPDPQGMLDYMHANHLRVSLNLHPAFGIANNEFASKEVRRDLGLPDTLNTVDWMLERKDFYKSVFNRLIRPHEKEGVDFWWLDWQQWPTNPRFEGLSETFWCNHVFFNDMKANRPDRRPVIFHRWGGLGSHRYQIGFSGDTWATFPTLAFEPYFTASASNVGYAYWGHDLGGHVQEGPNDPELYLRWIQYGVFSPIFRTHASNFPNIERRIWTFENFPLMLEAANLRYSLFPYIYSMARKTYDTGIGMCRPLYYEYPELEVAYSNENQYFFGDDILVAPIVEPADKATGKSFKKVWLPKGEWWSAMHGRMFKSTDDSTTFDMEFTQADIPYFVRSGGIVPRNPAGVMTVMERPSEMIIDIVRALPGQTSEFALYEDHGDSQGYEKGEYTTTLISQRVKGRKATYTIAPREGSFEGMPSERAYTINVLGTTRPSSVKVDGKTVKDWSYDASRQTTTVAVPSAPCAKGAKVEVTYSK